MAPTESRIRSIGRKAQAKQLEARYVWLTQGKQTLFSTKREPHVAIQSVKRRKSWLETQGGYGVPWTTRLKRLGGLAAIERLRAKHALELDTLLKSDAPPHKKKAATYAIEYLRGHPLRVLNDGVADFFGWSDKEDEGATKATKLFLTLGET